MTSFLQRLRQLYLEADPRTLALVRVLLACLLLFDLFKRIPEFAIWYDNDGLIPNVVALESYARPYRMMLFGWVTRWQEAAALAVLSAGVYLCLLVGYRTRVMQWLSFLLIISWQERVHITYNSGDIAFCLLNLWTAFLPLGRAFSIDALRSSMRSGGETTRTALEAVQARHAPVASLAVLAMHLQLAVIYMLNGAHKTGVTWKSGTAVWYALQQEQHIAWLGVWVRNHVPYPVLEAITYSTVVYEWLLGFLILSPVLRPYTRRIAVVGILLLHGSFEACLNIGVFSLSMCLYGVSLIDGGLWDRWREFASKRKRRLSVYYDGGCGVCFLVVRFLRRFDLYGRMRFVPNHLATEESDCPKGVTQELLEQTVIVLDRDSGDYFLRSDAFREVLRSLPFGILLSAPFVLPRALRDAAYDAFASRRARVSSFIGLGVCGVDKPTAAQAAPDAPSSRAQQLVSRFRIGLRETVVAFLLVAGTLMLIEANHRVFLEPFKLKCPKALEVPASYLRMLQSWNLFSPNVPQSIESIVVDAITVRGKHVDPINEVAARGASPEDLDPSDHEAIAYPNYNVYWADYLPRFHKYREYRSALRRWILKRHKRTGDPDDRIVSFKAYMVRQYSYKPRTKERIKPTVRRVFLHKKPKKRSKSRTKG